MAGWGGRLPLALLAPAGTWALALARGLLFACSDHWAWLLGAPCLGRAYHAWLAGAVLLGPLLAPFADPHALLASPRNYFSRTFVASAWGWTCVLAGGFALLAEAQVDSFRTQLCTQAEALVGTRFPNKIAQLDAFLKDPALNVTDLESLRAPLDIPIPDPAKEKAKAERRKKEEKKDEKKDEKKAEEEDKAPPCGPVSSNETVVRLVSRVKSEIQEAKEELGLVSVWVQLQVPRIEDGNNFGVAVQEKVFELMTALRTKLEGFQTQLSKYFSERGDAVAKAAKNPHVGDYRQLVHELDEAQYAELRLMVMEIRNLYAVLYDIVVKNFEKIKKPRGETKGMIY